MSLKNLYDSAKTSMSSVLRSWNMSPRTKTVCISCSRAYCLRFWQAQIISFVLPETPKCKSAVINILDTVLALLEGFMYDIDAIRSHFPMDGFRDGQEAAIKFVLKQFNNGKKFVIVEAPTGSGKTAIGMTVCGYNSSNYYLTSSKILQDQIYGDFSDKLVTLKGRNAYECTYLKRIDNTHKGKLIELTLRGDDHRGSYRSCSEGLCRSGAKSIIGADNGRCTSCFPKLNVFNYEGSATNIGTNKYSSCEYYEAIGQAMSSNIVTMNFSSFLTQLNYTKNRFNSRDMLVIDEGHNLEKELLDFVNLNIDQGFMDQHLQSIPICDTVQDYLDFFNDNDVLDQIERAIKNAQDDSDSDLEDELIRLSRKLEYFKTAAVGRADEWVVEHKIDQRGINSISFKPIYVRDQAHALVFGHAERVLIMSATILDVDVLCDSLGIDKEDCAAYRMRNRFPKENRPIIYDPVDRFVGGKAQAQTWLPKMAKRINQLMDKHKNERGIIHTHNFMIMDYLMNNVSESNRCRLINQKEYRSKNHMLDALAVSSNGVLIAPAMHEGLNLKDDLSRFQVICKMPYPNFYDDQQLNRRVEIDKKYLNWLTALKLVQSVGRSVRSAEDYAITYIIDGSFEGFLSRGKSMLPSWFLEAVTKPEVSIKGKP